MLPFGLRVGAKSSSAAAPIFAPQQQMGRNTKSNFWFFIGDLLLVQHRKVAELSGWRVSNHEIDLATSSSLEERDFLWGLAKVVYTLFFFFQKNNYFWLDAKKNGRQKQQKRDFILVLTLLL